MNNYEIDFPYLIEDLLHPLLRKPIMQAWLEALFVPLENLHSEFLDFVEAKRYEMDFTGQVISIERLLNNEFDNGLRRIYISDGNRAEVFLFKGDKPLGEEAFFFKGTEGIGEKFVFKGVSNLLYDFVVNVPASLAYDSVKMNTLINKYRQAGKKYIISTF